MPRSRNGWNIGTGGRRHVHLEARCAHVARHHLVDLGDELRRAQREIVVGDRLGARHQAEREARRVHVPEAPHVLEPHQRHVGGMLRLLHFEPPLGLEMRQRLFHVAPAGRLEGFVERDRVFHRELGAGADREMRGRLGVADQHDVVVRPALAVDGREIAPERAVDDQLVAAELLREHAFEEARRLFFAQLVEAGALERLRIGLQHPGRKARLVLVAMRDEDAVLGLAEEEREGVERPGRAHPGELVRPQVRARLEGVRVLGADARVDAVGRDDQIGVAVRGRIDLGLELHLDAERAGALLQQPQQGHARAAAEAVAADAVHRALEMDLDVVPVGEVVGDRAVALAVVFLERLERLVGEHDAEAERVVRPVALVDGELHLRPGLLRQDREIEPGRAAADHVDFHDAPRWSRRRTQNRVPLFLAPLRELL